MKTYICDIHGGPFPPNDFTRCRAPRGNRDRRRCEPSIWVKLEFTEYEVPLRELEDFVDEFRVSTPHEYPYDVLEPVVQFLELVLTGNYERTQDVGQMVGKPRRREGDGRPSPPRKGRRGNGDN